MRLAGLAFAFGITLLLGPAAAALPFSLDANLRWQEPARIDGLLTFAAPEGGHHLTAFLDKAPSGRTNLMTVHRAEVTVHHYAEVVDLPGRLPYEPNLLCDYCPSGKYLTNVLVDLAALRNASQIALNDPGHAALDQPAKWETRGAQCSLENPQEAESLRFPSDPNQIGAARNFGQSTGQLAGECTLEGLSAERPRYFLVYGIDVWLTSDEEGEKLVKTGTFVEPHPQTGVPRRVTQYLELRDEGSTAHAEIPWNATVSFHSRTFLGAGSLQVPAGNGTLTWAEQRTEGDVSPFQADGAFQFGWSEGGAVDVQGETLNGPTQRSSSSMPVAATWGLAAASAVGLLALGVFLKFLWTLFSRVPAERILEHPRRAQILDLARADPGIDVSRVARRLGMPWVKAAYHARRLEQAGLVLVRRVAGRRVLLPANAGLGQSAHQLVLLGRETNRRLLEMVHDRPGIDRQELAIRLGLTAARVSQAGRQLMDAGLITSARRRRRISYYPGPEGQV